MIDTRYGKASGYRDRPSRRHPKLSRLSSLQKLHQPNLQTLPRAMTLSLTLLDPDLDYVGFRA